jgi:hypothetical protein
MSTWTHSICSGCWNKKNPSREPVRMKGAPIEKCCYCGQPTSMGIFIRESPETVPCKGSH